MTLTQKDVAATILTALAVVVFLSAHQSWNVPLLGNSNRWAAGVVVLLGMATCSLGSPASAGRGAATTLSAILGALALLLAVSAIVTGSMTPLSLLVADIVLLWAISTVRHAAHRPRAPVAT